jgi:hypothetical protein
MARRTGLGDAASLSFTDASSHARLCQRVPNQTPSHMFPKPERGLPLQAKASATSPGLGKRPFWRFENTTASPRRTSKTPPLDGTRVTLPIRPGIALRTSSARPAARFSYPQEVQYSIDRSICSAIMCLPRREGPHGTRPAGILHRVARTIAHHRTSRIRVEGFICGGH